MYEQYLTNFPTSNFCLTFYRERSTPLEEAFKVPKEKIENEKARCPEKTDWVQNKGIAEGGRFFQGTLFFQMREKKRTRKWTRRK